MIDDNYDDDDFVSDFKLEGDAQGFSMPLDDDDDDDFQPRKSKANEANKSKSSSMYRGVQKQDTAQSGLSLPPLHTNQTEGTPRDSLAKEGLKQRGSYKLDSIKGKQSNKSK